MRETLKLTIDGRDGSIGVEPFLAVIRGSNSLLNDFSSPSEKWTIGDVKRVNPVHFEFVGEYDGAAQTVACIMDGLSCLHRGDDLPSYFTDSARKHLSSISKRLLNGISSVSFSSGNNKTYKFTESFYSYEKDLGLVEPYTVMAELEGVLETLDTHAGRSEFFIYDRLTGHGTECKFADLPLEEVKSLFGHRVRAFGTVQYDKFNKPKVMSVLRVRPIQNMATLDDVRQAGFSLDSNLSSSEIIKNLRSLDA